LTGPVAQWSERWSYIPLVGGSNPSGANMNKKYNWVKKRKIKIFKLNCITPALSRKQYEDLTVWLSYLDKLLWIEFNVLI
jgi:hypothetical protein